MAEASPRRWSMLQQLLRGLLLLRGTSTWVSGGPTGGRSLSGKEQLGISAAEQRKSNRLYVQSGKATIAGMYLRQVRVVGRTFMAALAHATTVLSRLRPRKKITEWAYGGLAG
jgi:hypothetical protein